MAANGKNIGDPTIDGAAAPQAAPAPAIPMPRVPAMAAAQATAAANPLPLFIIPAVPDAADLQGTLATGADGLLTIVDGHLQAHEPNGPWDIATYKFIGSLS